MATAIPIVAPEARPLGLLLDVGTSLLLLPLVVVVVVLVLVLAAAVVAVVPVAEVVVVVAVVVSAEVVDEDAREALAALVCEDPDCAVVPLAVMLK